MAVLNRVVEATPSPFRRAALLGGIGLLLGSAWVSLALPVLGLAGWAPGRMSVTLDLVAGIPPAAAGALFVASAAAGWRRLGEQPPTARWATGALLVLAAVAGVALLGIAALVLTVSALR